MQSVEALPARQETRCSEDQGSWLISSPQLWAVAASCQEEPVWSPGFSVWAGIWMLRLKQSLDAISSTWWREYVACIIMKYIYVLSEGLGWERNQTRVYIKPFPKLRDTEMNFTIWISTSGKLAVTKLTPLKVWGQIRPPNSCPMPSCSPACSAFDFHQR